MQHNLAVRLYQYFVLRRPLLVLLFIAIITAFFASFIPNFKLDISSDSLVLESDESLQYYRAINARYSGDDYLIITYSPRNGLFDTDTVNDLEKLHNSLAEIDRVESVISILNVPLISSPPMSLSEVRDNTRTLRSTDTDYELAQTELRESPLYKNRLVGSDGETTALQVNFKRDETYINLRDQRDTLREKQLEAPLSAGQQQALDKVSREFKQYSSALMAQEEADIDYIRALMAQHENFAELHIGGVPMIIADMMDYVRHDLIVFGLTVLAILAVLLAIAFKQLRWVVLPLLTASITSVMTIGFLGMVQWKVTVVSSNFLALLLIFTLSLTIHLIVRYRELQHDDPSADKSFLVGETVRSKFVPSFFTVITTMVAFISLVVSEIRPVIDFGWIMVIGLSIATALTFTLFPAVLMLLPTVPQRKQRDITGGITHLFAIAIERFGTAILILTVIIVILSGIGISRLTVDNRFIDYFKASTEIYQGMSLIDEKLGGTTPLDIIIDAPAEFLQQNTENAIFDEDFEIEGEAGITSTSYWFNTTELDRINDIHNYLESLNQTGKVVSLSTTLSVLKQLNDGEQMDDFFLSILYKNLPDDVKKSMITPYMSEDGNQLRFAVRIYESDASLQRQQLLDKIEHDLVEKFDLKPDQVHLTGMMVLFNNLLQSLYQSQILTLGAVFLAIFLMFTVLFRSVKLAVIAIIPNLVTCGIVLGLMGGFNIPLDIMTITIAAISVGIAVDDTIHYMHRFKEELTHDWDYSATVARSHGSIGRAMYYTSVVITIGFSILTLSNFVPTIYFGILTAFAMVAALIANLTVLAVLLEKFQPYGKKAKA